MPVVFKLRSNLPKDPGEQKAVPFKRGIQTSKRNGLLVSFFNNRRKLKLMNNCFPFLELRLAQLALDPNNSPGWDVLEQERSVSTKMPLFVRSFLVYHNKMRQTEVTGGTSYTLLIQTPTRAQRPQT